MSDRKVYTVEVEADMEIEGTLEEAKEAAEDLVNQIYTFTDAHSASAWVRDSEHRIVG